MIDDIKPGQVFAAWYPFRRDKVTLWDVDGPADTPTWVPGTRSEYVPPDTAEDVYDGAGKILLTVVSVHRPGRYPLRVFYTRQWEDPNGRRFGKNGLRITTQAAFRRLANGYRHPCRLVNGAPHDPISNPRP